MSYSVCGNNLGPDGFMEELYLGITGTTERGTENPVNCFSRKSSLKCSQCENVWKHCHLLWVDALLHRKGVPLLLSPLAGLLGMTLKRWGRGSCRLYSGLLQTLWMTLGYFRPTWSGQRSCRQTETRWTHQRSSSTDSPVWHWPWYSGGFWSCAVIRTTEANDIYIYKQI